MTETETAWLAGLLEGEGSFLIVKSRVNGKLYEYPDIVVSMTDLDVITKASKLMGNKVHFIKNQREGWKNQYRTRIGGQGAIDLMRKLLPYMGSRRSEKINELISDWEARPNANLSRSESMKRTLAAKRAALKATNSHAS